MDLEKANGHKQFTPPIKRRRLPRALSGTKAAADRKKELQKLRQRRKRARERSEAYREEKMATSSSEDNGGGGNEDQRSYYEEEEEEQEEGGIRQPHFRDVEADDAKILARTEVDAVQLPVNNRSLPHEDTNESPPIRHSTTYSSPLVDAIDDLARQFAIIKCSSFVSDAGIDKLFRMFVLHNDTIMHLVRTGAMAGNYVNGVRPLLSSLPRYCPSTTQSY